MAGFDQQAVFTSASRDDEEHLGENHEIIDVHGYKKLFKEFIRQYQTGNFDYKYRLGSGSAKADQKIISKFFNLEEIL